MVTTPVGGAVVAKRVYRNCPIMFPSRFKHFELVELDMVDFDVIFGMDLLHACFAYIYCRTRVVKFNFSNELFLEWKGENLIPRDRIISFMKYYRMISKGFLYHMVKVYDLDSEIPPIESFP